MINPMDSIKKDSRQKTLIDKFNKVINIMLDHIIRYHRSDDLEKVRSLIDQYIVCYPEEPISNFLIHIYRNDIYRESILNGDDKFFMESKYQDIRPDSYQSSICNYFSKEQYIRKLLEFKDIWGTMDLPTKEFIKKTMLCLVKISEKYILSI